VSEGLCPAAKVHVLHSGSIDGVDSEGRFHPKIETEEVRAARRRSFGIPPEALVIGYVGRIVRDKGVGELVEAWEQLAREFPQLHMLVVGEFEPQDPVPAAVEQTLRATERIHLAGFSTDTPSLYAAMDVVVLPSYREGMGLVLLEAGAMGLPVVATRIPGIVDAVLEGKTGTLVPPRDPSALAEAIRKYLRDPELRLQHGLLGRERVVRDFRPERLWEATYQEYVHLLKKRGFKIDPVCESRPGDEAVETNRPSDSAGDNPVREAGSGKGRARVARVFKRIIDLSAALILLFVLAPVMAVVALLIRMDMGRPVLFRQVRPGRRAKPFTLYKFRTMTESCSEEGVPRPDAERLTDLGRFLRRTSLDELPQLLNVLRGDVSLVGPRPLLVEYLPLYSPEQARRHEVKPGITGWAQVNGRNAIEWSRKLELDVWYVDHWSLWLDMKILAVTVLKVLRMEGISGKGEATAAPFTGKDEGKPCNRSGYSVQAVTPRS